MQKLSKMMTRALAATLATSMCLMPVGAAFADQVLEVAQTAASSAPSRAAMNSSTYGTNPHHAHRQVMAPLTKNLGTLQDYERETESDPSTSAPARFASGLARAQVNQRSEGHHNRDMLAQNAILGVLMIGLFAMELNASHHHRHH